MAKMTQAQMKKEMAKKMTPAQRKAHMKKMAAMKKRG